MTMTSGMFVPTAAMKARMMTVPGSDSTISLTRFMSPSPRRLRAAQSVIGTVITTATIGTMQRDQQRRGGRGDDARQQVAAELVGAEEVRERGALQHGGEVLLERPVAQPQRAR